MSSSEKLVRFLILLTAIGKVVFDGLHIKNIDSSKEDLPQLFLSKNKLTSTNPENVHF